MAFNFPNSPTDGQIFVDGTTGVSYTWNATYSTWRINATGGGGIFKGNNGTVGAVAGLGDIFRVNTDTLSSNVFISTGENAQGAGPITISLGRILTINSGGRVVIT